MQTYVCLLRGINVGGHRKILMAELRELCGTLGLENVATYLQSGNLVCESELSTASSLATLLEQAIEERFGFSVPTIVRTGEELLETLDANPFTDRSEVDPGKLLVAFLQTVPSPAQTMRLADLESGSDQLVCVDDAVFLHCPNGIGHSRLSNKVLERHFGTVATGRNWRTVNALAEMLQDR